jgi:hypothetical protein
MLVAHEVAPATLIWEVLPEAQLAALSSSLPSPELEFESEATSIPSWPKWITRPEP